MRHVSKLAAIALLLCWAPIVSAEQTNIYLFLDTETIETKIDGLDVGLMSELKDDKGTERDFMWRPRVWINCLENGRQIMTIDVAGDLDPWPAVSSGRDLEVNGSLISQTGSFPDLPARIQASRVTHLLKVSVDITGRAEAAARAWLQGFPIKLTASPGQGLKDLSLVIFPSSSSPGFRAHMGALVRGCEVLAGN